MLVEVLIPILKLWLYHLRWNNLRRWSISLCRLLLARFSWVRDRSRFLLFSPTNFVVSFQAVKKYSTAKDNNHSRNHDINNPACYADVLWQSRRVKKVRPLFAQRIYRWPQVVLQTFNTSSADFQLGRCNIVGSKSLKLLGAWIDNYWFDRWAIKTASCAV